LLKRAEQVFDVNRKTTKRSLKFCSEQ